MKKPKIWAHRGASGWDKQYGPENTLIAFEKAVQMGADGVEMDVQLTKDDEIVICHDETIDRTSDGKGEIREYTLAELKKFNFGKPHPECGFVPIPTLAEFLDLMKNNDLTINIELKTGVRFYPGLEEKTVALVEKFGMQDRVIYSSFNHESVMWAKKCAQGGQFAFLTGRPIAEMAALARLRGVDALHPSIDALKQTLFLVKDAHDAGLKINVWTVDKWDDMKNMCYLGVDVFVTNCPDHARRIVDGYCP